MVAPQVGQSLGLAEELFQLQDTEPKTISDL